MSIPVIINNCNLLTYPKQMVASLAEFDDIGDIIIVDNNSTYEPLLDWYATNPCKIVRTNSSHHLTPWYINLPQQLKASFYVVTDPDLDLSITPKDALVYLQDKIKYNNTYDKIGLSLKNWNVSSTSPYYQFLKDWSSITWDVSSLKNGLLTNQQVDTTFAIYDINRNPCGKSCATYLPYSVNHIPWEFSSEYIRDLKTNNYEYYYYLCKSNNSSSYKAFIDFKENNL